MIISSSFRKRLGLRRWDGGGRGEQHTGNWTHAHLCLSTDLSGNLEGPKVFDKISTEKPTWQTPKLFPSWIWLVFWNPGEGRQLPSLFPLAWSQPIALAFVYIGRLQWLKSLETRGGNPAHRPRANPRILSCPKGSLLVGRVVGKQELMGLLGLGVWEMVLLCRLG